MPVRHAPLSLDDVVIFKDTDLVKAFPSSQRCREATLAFVTNPLRSASHGTPPSSPFPTSTRWSSRSRRFEKDRDAPRRCRVGCVKRVDCAHLTEASLRNAGRGVESCRVDPAFSHPRLQRRAEHRRPTLDVVPSRFTLPQHTLMRLPGSEILNGEPRNTTVQPE